MLETMYNKTYEILAVATVSDDKGGRTETITVGSTIRGLIVPVSAFEAARFSKTTAEITDRLYCGSGTTITFNSRVREKGTTLNYEVIDVRDGTLGANAHKEIDLKRTITI